MKTAGIVVRAENPQAKNAAKKLKISYLVSKDDWSLPWDGVLFIGAGVCVPWEMLGYGFHFLERWDAAAPLWRYGVLAGSLGSKAEKVRTKEICLDLRLLTYEPGLFFVRNNAPGRALVEAWRKECQPKWDERLAFLRALHLVKPEFCALPRSWLADVQQRSKQDARARTSIRSVPQNLVSIEVRPGVYVKCRAGEEEKTRQQYAKLERHRQERFRK